MTPAEAAHVNALTNRVADLEATRDHLKSGAEALLANRRSRYQEVSQWARHYSTVRMTVTTFLLGLCVTVISFGCNHLDKYPRQPSVLIAAALWLIAVALFTVFTRLTLQMGARAAEHRRNLPVDDAPPPARTSSRDAASWALTAISFGFAGLVWWTRGFYSALWFLLALLVVVLLGIALTVEKE